MPRLSIHRLLQLHELADSLYARARVCLRGAGNLYAIGNKRGAHYQRCRGLRYQAIADRATRRITQSNAQERAA